MGGHGAIEVAKTVLEVADVAWTAMECRHHHQTSHEQEGGPESKCASSEDELEALRSENRRLRNLLEQNLKLLQDLSESPCLFNDCPPDVRLYFFFFSFSFLVLVEIFYVK
jgi:hypothetical protein